MTDWIDALPFAQGPRSPWYPQTGSFSGMVFVELGGPPQSKSVSFNTDLGRVNCSCKHGYNEGYTMKLLHNIRSSMMCHLMVANFSLP